MKYNGSKLTWKKDYGDGEITDDAVLWINGQPSTIVISGAESGWYGTLYIGDREVAIADTRKELKDILFQEHTKELEEQIKLCK